MNTETENKIDIAAHVMRDNSAPAVYVGTYAKYAAGSINGEWLDLTTFDDVDEFYNVARALHADEKEPEFMFQDFQGFPRELYEEAAGPDDVENWLAYFALDNYDRELLDAWLEVKATGAESVDEMLEAAQDAFFCHVSDCSWYAVAEYCVEEGLVEIPENMRYYFDYEAYGRDLSMEMTMSKDGHVFHDC